MLNMGAVRIQAGQGVVTTGPCAEVVEVPEAPDTLVATLIGLRDRDCAVTEAGRRDFVAEIGTREVVMGHLRELQEAQFLTLSSAAGGVLLSARLCQGNDAGISSLAA